MFVLTEGPAPYTCVLLDEFNIFDGLAIARFTGRWYPTVDAVYQFQACSFSPGGGGSYSEADFSHIISFRWGPRCHSG